MPTFPLMGLGAFRTELHACFTRRADALVELGDALVRVVVEVAMARHLPHHTALWNRL